MKHSRLQKIRPFKNDDGSEMDASFQLLSQNRILIEADGTWSSGIPFNVDHERALVRLIKTQVFDFDNAIVSVFTGYTDEPVEIEIANEALRPKGLKHKDKIVSQNLPTVKERIRSFPVNSSMFEGIDQLGASTTIAYLLRYVCAAMRRVFNPSSSKNGLRLRSAMIIEFENSISFERARVEIAPRMDDQTMPQDDAHMYWARKRDDEELRERLIKANADVACVLTNWSYFEVAHVVPWSVCSTNEQRRSLDNVLPLSPDLHAAFDLNEWCFDLNGVVLLSEHLSALRRRELERRIFNWKLESYWLKQVSQSNLAQRLELFKQSEAKPAL